MRLAGTKLAANHQYRGFGDQLYDLSGQRPSLDLNFANSKSLVDATTAQNLVTFTRASSGTYVGSDGLIKTAVTNLQTNSENIASLGTLVGSTVTSNITLAPDGQTTADKLVEDTSTGGHQVSGISIAWAGNTTYTVSVYAKADTRTQLTVAFGTSSNWVNSSRTATFNLANGTISSQSIAPLTASIQALSNGWYRCVVSATTVASPVASTLVLQLNNGVSTSYTGDGTSGLFLWGAQLEQSSTVGEYIPTTSTINSAPRFDHNPTTGESLGLLVEESRTNLTQKSQEFEDVYWTKTDCTITANESTAPDGTLTADLWTNTTSPGIISNSITKDATSRTYTGSLWVKGNATQFTMSIDNGGTVNRGRVVFNLSSNTISSANNDGNFTNTSGSITLYSDGWKRLTITTTTSTITTIRFRPFFSGSGSTVRIWGAQVEEGTFATSYIPTTTATVTRSADVASITGANFSSWYRQDEGTVFADNTSYAINNTRIASFSDNTASNRVLIARGSGSGGNINITVTVDGTVQVSSFVFASSLGANTALKVAGGFKASDFAGSVNGAAPTTRTSGSMATTVNQLGIGNGEVLGTNTFSGTIRRLVYWPQRLSNSTLQQITQ